MNNSSNIIEIDFANEHRDLWLFRAKNPAERRIEWPGWKRTASDGSVFDLRNYVLFNCFACQAVWANCSICPLQWPEGKTCVEPESLYRHTRRFECTHPALSGVLTEIADLPWVGERLFWFDLSEWKFLNL